MQRETRTCDLSAYSAGSDDEQSGYWIDASESTELHNVGLHVLGPEKPNMSYNPRPGHNDGNEGHLSFYSTVAFHLSVFYFLPKMCHYFNKSYQEI